MDNKQKYGGIEDLFDLTDSEDSSSSSNPGVFESHDPFVLELHDVVKDDPTTGSALPAAKVKKHRKKKGQPGNQTSDTSSSVSESSVPPATGLEEHSREEFYDAHESYHGLTGIAENQVADNPVITAGIVQARSEHGPASKLTPEQAPLAPGQEALAPGQTPLALGQTQPGSGTRRDPSIITKPATGPQ